MMAEDPVRTYMSHALLIAWCQRHGEKYDHLMGPLNKALEKLNPKILSVVERRLDSAIAELLDDAPAPRPANLQRDGIDAVEVDIHGDELVATYRQQFANHKRLSSVERLYSGIAEDAKAAMEKLEERRQKRQEEQARAQAAAENTTDSRVPLYDAGVWQPGTAYRAGDVVTDQNALWVCKAETTARPPSDHWRLAVKPVARERRYDSAPGSRGTGSPR